MSQIFTPLGAVVPVTKIQAGPCVVTQIKNDKKENVTAVQLGFGVKKEYLLKKPQIGHLKGLGAWEFLQDFELDNSENIERGDMVTADTFAVGDKVMVVGESKGKGFAGVVKRHHFKGGPASHGHKDNLRAPGSIGAGGVQRVFKGMRMAGRMGGARVTVKNLEVVKVDAENNEIFLKGAVPGGRNSILAISSPGELKVAKTAKAAAVSEPVNQ